MIEEGMPLEQPEDVQRVELFCSSRPGGQSLNLKFTDLNVGLLSRVFKLKPDTIYLEESSTKYAEFPRSDGTFNLGTAHGHRYEVVGETQAAINTTTTTDDFEDQVPAVTRPFTRRSSGTSFWPRPWSGINITSGQGSSSSSQQQVLSKKPSSPPSWRRCIPHASLAVDGSGKGLCVESTIKNIFLKIPESDVSTRAILNEASNRIEGVETAADLLILDSKLIPIKDEGEQLDIEFWKVPSRRLYIVNSADYEDLNRTVRRNKKSLKLRKSFQGGASVVDSDNEVTKLLDVVTKLSNQVDNITNMMTSVIGEVANNLECKICKDLPRNPIFVTCCGQVLGCRECGDEWINDNSSCPLCRAEVFEIHSVKGHDEAYGILRGCKGGSTTQPQ